MFRLNFWNKIKKLISFFTALGICVSFTSCSNENSQRMEQIPQKSTETLFQTDNQGTESFQSDEEIITTENLPEISTEHEEIHRSNILIAYFTWAENTNVENPDSVDVDAVTSASVLLPGNVAKMANWIHEETSGDLFSIITEEAYSSDYDECLDRAVDEYDSNARPALTAKVDNIDEYDIVFLGFPNWWYSCPMAILTFIDENDLSGKTIIPFCSHGTGRFAASLRDIGNELPDDCTVLKEFGAYRPEVDNSKSDLIEWLRGLNFQY